MLSGFALRFTQNVLIFLLWLWFFSLTMERRYSRFVTVILFIATYFIYWIVYYLPQGSPFRTIIILAASLILSFCGFRGSTMRHIVLSLIALAATAVTEIIVLLIIPDQLLIPTDSEILKQPHMILSQVIYPIILGALLWICSLVANRYKTRLTPLQWLSYTLVPLSQALSFTAFSYMMLLGISGYTLFAIIVCIVCFIVADVLTVFAMRDTAENAELEAKNRMLAKQINAQTEYYTNLAQQYEENRRMRHDIQHHLHTMQILIEQGRHEDASQYAAELLPAHKSQPKLLQCENTIVDAFLYSRMQEAERSGIQVTADIAIPAELAIRNTDLIIAFGNILDNAIEACNGVEHPEIRISAHISKGCLVLYEENPVALSSQNKQRRIPDLERGLGLRILEDLSKKYNGQLQYETENERFRITLVLNFEGDFLCLT